MHGTHNKFVTHLSVVRFYSMPCVFGTETTLSSMSHFYKNIRGHGDPSQRYMQSALNSLGAARAGVLMMGDSTLMVSAVVRV